MTGGQSDRRDLDRRAFIRRAGQTGVAAGALAWSTPRVRSVEAQAAAGSPPPVNTSPSVAGAPITPAGPGSPDLVLGVQEAPPSGSLAITGAELGQMAALGAAAVGTGELLRRKGLQRRGALEADAERLGDAPPDPAEPLHPA